VYVSVTVLSTVVNTLGSAYDEYIENTMNFVSVVNITSTIPITITTM